MVRWIMDCVTSANYVVLINGAPNESSFGTQGSRKGCPLSPYLFLLIIEGLSLLIAQAKNSKRIKGIQVTSSITLTHTFLLMMSYSSVMEVC